jgi:hypothetical protein
MHFREQLVGGSWRAVSTVAREGGAVTEENRHELTLEAQAAIGEFLGKRVVRFPRLASRLLARFAAGSLPDAMMSRLRRVACVAVREQVERIALASVPTLTARELGRVNEQVDAMLVQVRKASTRSPRAARAAQAHAALLEQYRAAALAAVAI